MNSTYQVWVELANGEPYLVREFFQNNLYIGETLESYVQKFIQETLKTGFVFHKESNQYVRFNKLWSNKHE
jgi:hypothetical protein